MSRGEREAEDWAARARSSTKEEFVRAHPHLFLVGTRQMIIPRRSTGVWNQLPSRTGKPELDVQLAPDRTAPLALTFPLRSRDGNPDAGVTVGRTDVSDVVIPEDLISRAHAVFHFVPDGVELVDLGSANGTFVGELQLTARTRQRVQPGDQIRFSHFVFVLLDAAAAWERLRGESA